MTNKEALEIMEKYHSGLSVLSSDYMAACSKSHAALSKQIPMSPIGENHVCACCGDVEFGFNMVKYCDNCGQAINWEGIINE